KSRFVVRNLERRLESVESSVRGKGIRRVRHGLDVDSTGLWHILLVQPCHRHRRVQFRPVAVIKAIGHSGMSAVKDGCPADRGLVPARGKIGPPPIIIHDRWWKRLGLTGAPVDDEEVAWLASAQHARGSQARGPMSRTPL